MSLRKGNLVFVKMIAGYLVKISMIVEFLEIVIINPVVIKIEHLLGSSTLAERMCKSASVENSSDSRTLHLDNYAK